MLSSVRWCSLPSSVYDLSKAFGPVIFISHWSFACVQIKTSQSPDSGRDLRRPGWIAGVYAFPVKTGIAPSLVKQVYRSWQLARKRQLMPVRVWHVKIALAPGPILRPGRIESAFFQMGPGCVNIGHIQDQPTPTPSRMTFFAD
jgi:hypothetical protein